MTPKVGILGGTFDPVHIGHLVLAEQARDQLGLERVLFVPAAVPPHKLDRAISDAKVRREMVEIAIGGNPAFEVSTVELDRGGISYTVDTLQAISEKNNRAELCLIVGADTLADVPNWRQPDRVVELASFAVAGRPGFELTLPERWPHIKVHRVEMPMLDISSSRLRRAVERGESIRYLVPPGVGAYIQSKGLYRGAS